MVVTKCSLNVQTLSSATASFCPQKGRIVFTDGNSMHNARKYWTVNVNKQNKYENPIHLVQAVTSNLEFLTLFSDKRNTCLQFSDSLKHRDLSLYVSTKIDR